MARYQRPDPRTGPRTGGTDGKGGNNNSLEFEAFLPGQLNALSGQLSRFGGTKKGWKGDLRDMTAPMEVGLPKPFRRGGGGNNGGGKDDPNNPRPKPDGTGGHNGGFDPSRPDHKMVPMAMPMQRGFLQAGQPMNQMPTSGIFAAQQQMQQPMQAQQPGAAQQPQLPPEILAMMRARQMGR